MTVVAVFPGEPEVKLIGVQSDIHVRCEPIGPCRYRCCYVADRQGMLIYTILLVFDLLAIEIDVSLIYAVICFN